MVSSFRGTLSVSSAVAEPPLEKPADRPRFPNSLPLSPEELGGLTSNNYYFLAGILGSPKAGKTALLVSLYLMAANGKLEGYQIADSLTLMGIDEISRGARRWNQGQMPEEMTAHTELPDERIAGFLHLRLKRLCDGKVLDLLLPDLPGEWSESFINYKRTDRLSFLKSADVLWITIDGSELTRSRQQVLHRTQMLFHRIKVFLQVETPKIIVVISHLDRGKPEPRNIKVLEDEAASLGLDVSIINVASFSDVDAIEPGTGLRDLIVATFDARSAEPVAFWPDRERAEEGRYLWRFRAERDNSR